MKILFNNLICESIKKLDGGNILLSDYVGDIVNLLTNKPKPYRIVYNEYDDVYLIADAQSYIHEDMTEIALDEGYLPNSKEFMQKYHEDIDDFDAYRTVNLIFLRDKDLSDFGSYTDKYATAEFGYEYPITTGSLFTKASYSKSYLQQAVPDLYKKLSKYSIDEPRVLEDSSWN